MTFRIGDRVKLRNGKNTLIVEHIYGTTLSARYEKTGQLISKRVNELMLADENTEQNEGYNTMKGKLFQIKEDTARFGIGLAINSAGKYVLEMKGTGDLEAFDKKDIDVVMPFTFSVKFSTGDQEYQYLGKEGTVEVGDLLLSLNSQHKNGGISIAQVVNVNTKSDKAGKYFDGVKIKTEPLDQE